ncbi:ester cyclase [Streptosporangiaceae bacterium NEAU-GS5]|nr:ester cyclase [Streptosporangiaceae bacterium NEAU-GS5]
MTREEHNMEVVQRFMDEVQNARGYDKVTEFCRPDQVLDHPELGGPVRGLAILEEKINDMVRAFPDMHFATEEMIAEGDQVAVRFTLTGTQTGWLGPVKPSGKPIVQSGMAVYDMKDGKIQEVRIREDLLQMLDQLGAIPDNPRLLYWMNKTGILKLLQAIGKVPK